MKILTAIILSLISVFVYGQNNQSLKLTDTKENVVASAIDGSWKSRTAKNEHSIDFVKDAGVLKIISKNFYKDFQNLKIYHAGYVKFVKSNNTKVHPFILTELNGNPHFVYFREKDGNPFGDAESFILFIAVGESKEKDRLFIGGDFNNQGFAEYERTK